MPNGRSGRGRPRTLLVAGLLVAGGIAGVALTEATRTAIDVTNRTAFCTNCHVYADFGQRFRRTVHHANASGVRVSCGECHIPGDNIVTEAWNKAVAGINGGFAYFVQGIDTPAAFRQRLPQLREQTTAWFVANNSATCRSCHAVAAMAASAQNPAARGAHASLAGEGGPTCVDCHADIAHPGRDSSPGVGDEARGTAVASAETAEPDAADDGAAAANGGETSSRAAAGERIARNVCTSCHELPTGEGAPVGPAFDEIAARGELGAGEVADVMQQGPHGALGGQLGEDDHAALAAYLNSL